ncbi:MULTISPECIES: hypothetical protein [unclassified Siphonobacter]|uniref:hypothetical protein n=1 Tax=unclassified Siphonobacter TaxID=2635712 RepID=UPI000CC86A6D|nr:MULTISPECIES: hypothetical protein [unclassified Siphonobacter]MDQ1089624.1 multisubunit Na+/H+ antiporter MnhG subunit [Siphonobacter sp. SORGH_AS_1065]MDR6195873.1 multisubunit Na+/H+ antiporter MnhG subunit [Siphonobacter sp. SORGH_AS_0500]PKK37375.1 hypothetical protein BWI96_05745 [Siphonobacter sp. SORGH_AS_0500]
MKSKLPLEAELEPLFLRKLPPMPFNVKDGFVQVMPWIALINGILGIVRLIKVYSDSYAISYGVTTEATFSLLATAVTSILSLLAFTSLRANRRRGWNFLYFAVLISTVLNLLSGVLDFGIGEILFTLLFSTFELWVLFNIRERYW